MSAPSVTLNAGPVLNPIRGTDVARDNKGERGRPKSDTPKASVISTRLEPEWQAVWIEFLEACDPPTTEAAALRQALKQYLRARGYAPKSEGGK